MSIVVVIMVMMDLWSWWFCGHSRDHVSVVIMVMEVLAMVIVVLWSW